MKPNLLIEAALHRALKAYAGKTDRGGKAYILHPIRLMAKLDDPIGQCVAVLHDAIEDDPETTADVLRADGFPEAVISAVVALTKVEGESEDDYLIRVRENPLARKIKLLDIEDNMNLLRLNKVSDKDLERIAKYHRAWKLLDSPEADV